jgi:hypothetical protein
MENGAAPWQAGGRATDALEAIIRRLRASAARPPLPLRCVLARTPNNPAIVRLRLQRGNPAAKLPASAAMQQKRYDASWEKSTMSKEFVTPEPNLRSLGFMR